MLPGENSQKNWRIPNGMQPSKNATRQKTHKRKAEGVQNDESVSRSLYVHYRVFAADPLGCALNGCRKLPWDAANCRRAVNRRIPSQAAIIGRKLAFRWSCG